MEQLENKSLDAIRRGFAATLEPSAGVHQSLAKWRASALDRFLSRGFPDRHSEAWRYTNPKPSFRMPFEVAQGLPATASTSARRWLEFASGDDHWLVVVNGRLAPELCRIQKLTPGVGLSPWAESVDLAGEKSAWQGFRDEGLRPLADAFSVEGLALKIAAGTEVHSPIYVLHLEDGAAVSHLSTPRLSVVLEKNSKAEIIELFHHGSDGASHIQNAVTSIDVGEGAEVLHRRFMHGGSSGSHFGSLDVRVAAHGAFHSLQVGTGGKTLRSDLSLLCTGEGSEIRILGLALADAKNHIDFQTTIDHVVGQNSSYQHHRSMVKPGGTAVFHGAVAIRPNAQMVSARQYNKNLLLGDGATVYAKPSLDIQADNVTCAHGSTVASLAASEILYALTRGIPEDDARQLLARAFGNDVLHEAALRPEVSRLVGAFLGAFY